MEKKANGNKTKPKTKAEKEVYWRRMIKEHQKSGLTQTEFAKQQGFRADTFRTWKKQLEEAESQKGEKATPSPRKVENPPRALAKTKGSEAKASAHPIELKHQSGFSLLLDGSDEVLLKQVLKSLADISHD